MSDLFAQETLKKIAALIVSFVWAGVSVLLSATVTTFQTGYARVLLALGAVLVLIMYKWLERVSSIAKETAILLPAQA